MIDKWTMEWYSDEHKTWRNVYTDNRYWKTLEGAVTALREDVEEHERLLGFIPNIVCVLRLRNLRTNEVIPSSAIV